MLFPKLLFFVCSLQLFRTVQANHVLFSIFELGSKVPKIVTSSHNQTCFGCDFIDKKGTQNPLFGRNKHIFCTVMQIISILVCFSMQVKIL